MTLLKNPRDCLFGAPSTVAEYEAVASLRAQKVGRRVTEDGRQLEAYVSGGLWVADCPHCNAGIAIHPEWGRAYCLGCHRMFADIAMPAEWPAIEAALAVRPERHQHWLASKVRTRLSGRPVALPAERVDDLEAENVEHGLTRRIGRSL